MSSRQLLIKRQLPRLVTRLYEIRRYASNASEPNELVDIDVLTRHEVRLSSHKPKQKQRKPFAKNLYLGKYDTELCAFPEPQSHERHKDFFDWLKPIEDYVNSSIDIRQIDKSAKIPSKVIEQMKELGVFRANLPEEYKGLALNSSEYSKLVETFSKVPVLGAYLVKRATAINLITSFGSDNLQSTYLPKIASGEFIPTVSISEDKQGSNDSLIVSKANLSDCENFWILNGTKYNVVNVQNANLFIVIAECSDDEKSFRPDDTLTAFLVEKDFDGITVSPCLDTVGLCGLEIGHINFKDTKIPKENIIGQIGMAGKNFISIFGEGKDIIGAQAIGITKGFLQALVKNLKERADFNTAKFQHDSTQEIIGKICCSIYGMESVLYLTTGMIDTFTDQDCIIEKCMVETFCANECVQSIILGMQLLGLEGQSMDNIFQQYLRDAICLTSIDGSAIHTKSFISLLGFQHTGQCISEEVKFQRNRWNNPLRALKFLATLESRDKLLIAENLHPSLSDSAEMLEEGIFRLKKSVQNIAIRDGIHLLEKHMVLRRFSETSTYLYVMAAILSRASRSYCLGMRDSEKELRIAQVYAFIIYERFTALVEQLEAGEWVNGDCMMKSISDGVFETDSYSVEHPMARNF